MDPTPTPAAATTPAPATTPTNPAAADALVDLFRTQRQNVGFFLATLSVLFLASTAFLFYQGYREPAAAEKKEKSNIEKQFEPDNPESKLDEEKVNPKRTDYLLGGILTLFACLAMGGMALWLMGGLPYPDEAQQRSMARIQILAACGFLGLLLMMAGAVYFYLWLDSFGAAFEKGKDKDLIWVGIPLFMVLLGAALVLAGAQPARVEERNNTRIRRLVYGANLALTTMLLVVVLIVSNVMIAYHVTSKFDTTSSGFYSMSPQTEEFLGSLDQTMLAYAILPGHNTRQENDLRDVLTRFQEVSHEKFKVTFVNSSLNTIELAELMKEFPTTIQDGTMGVLLTFASDKKRFSFIPYMDFFSVERAQEMGSEPRRMFIGEGRLIKELLFLADNKQRPKIYFTQSSGEMRLSASEIVPTRGLSSLQSYLEKNYLEVKPLVLETENPKVPDDCAILVVADPDRTMPKNQADAIQKYMNEPLPGGRKGKLVVLSGAPIPTEKNQNPKFTPTGLEGLLRGFNVGLEDKYIFMLARDRTVQPFEPTLRIAPEAVRANNPIAKMFRANGFPSLFPREVRPLSSSPQFTALPLLTTASNGLVWTESSLPNKDFEQAALDAQNRGQLLATRPVGVVVSEGSSPRLAVFGDAIFLCDEFGGERQGENALFDLFRASIDWLRRTAANTQRRPVQDLRGVLAGERQDDR